MKKFFVEIGDKPLAVYFVIFVEYESIVYSHIIEAIHNMLMWNISKLQYWVIPILFLGSTHVRRRGGVAG